MSAPTKRKRLGQHFLTDPQTIDRIVRLINPSPDETMVEIGPGRGALTERLAGRTAEFHAIEIDPHLFGEIHRKMASESVQIHHGDALSFDYGSLMSAGQGLRIVGNLPYSISSQLIMRLLKFADGIKDLVFMLQREVALRLTAPCGSRHYGRLTVCVTRVMHVEMIFDVPPGAFSPPPEVQSTMIYMRPEEVTDTDSRTEEAFAALVRLAFSNRRKTLRNSLASPLGETHLAQCGIDPGLRAQNLTVGQYLRLAEYAISNNLDVR
ncbi:MAG: 16S rRNA (adenine(1518)-N(6)/adenine(1519)-N(6))-dimethyltransferase RsmA [Acidiferrobacterales bacterium]|nr:16S rRNA (adenine(1518)-N(6)/adenine(1519)-N(6))-dimethyltransferase RsmA [Acidiferrobacterales bacterium]